MGMPSLWSEAIAMAADDALIQPMRESCGRLCSNKSFTTVDHIPVMCCNLQLFHLLTWIGSKTKDFPSGNVLMVVSKCVKYR